MSETEAFKGNIEWLGWDAPAIELVPLSPHAPHPLPLSLPMPDYTRLSEMKGKN